MDGEDPLSNLDDGLPIAHIEDHSPLQEGDTIDVLMDPKYP